VKAIVMRLVHPLRVAAILVPLVGLFSACSTEINEPHVLSVGGAGGSSESSSPMGAGGGDMADAAPLDATAYCPGDAGAWQQLTAEASACEKGSDCCVIMSPCLSQAQIVAAARRDEASSAWPYCDLACVDCIPPAIDVACVQGMCLGRVIPGAPPDAPQRKDHCGGDDYPALDFSGPTGLHFGCGG
jgi:hypothetical protein